MSRLSRTFGAAMSLHRSDWDLRPDGPAREQSQAMKSKQQKDERELKWNLET
jgi:hypothetical protein